MKIIGHYMSKMGLLMRGISQACLWLSQSFPTPGPPDPLIFSPPLPLLQVSRWKEADGRALTSWKMLGAILITNTLLQGGPKTETPVVNESYSRGLHRLNAPLFYHFVFLDVCFLKGHTHTLSVLNMVLYYYKHITLPYIASYTVNNVLSYQ